MRYLYTTRHLSKSFRFQDSLKSAQSNTRDACHLYGPATQSHSHATFFYFHLPFIAFVLYRNGPVHQEAAELAKNKVTSAVLTVNIGSDAKAIKRAIDEIRKVIVTFYRFVTSAIHRGSLIFHSIPFRSLSLGIRCLGTCPSCASAPMLRS